MCDNVTHIATRLHELSAVVCWLIWTIPKLVLSILTNFPKLHFVNLDGFSKTGDVFCWRRLFDAIAPSPARTFDYSFVLQLYPLQEEKILLKIKPILEEITSPAKKYRRITRKDGQDKSRKYSKRTVLAQFRPFLLSELLATLSGQHLIGNLTKNRRFYSDQNTKQLTDHETVQCEATFSRFIYKQERSKCLLNYWCCWPFQLPLWYFHRDKNIEGLITGHTAKIWYSSK